MKTQHTAGPWEITPERRIYRNFWIDGKRMAQFVAACDSSEDYCPLKVQEANAKLIAAAPELLAALIEAQATLLHNGIDTGPLPGISQRIRYAISKATE